MVAFIEDKMDAIRKACERFHVVRLDIFGSVLRTILGSEVDLVMVGALKNRYIRDDVNRTKQQLYAA